MSAPTPQTWTLTLTAEQINAIEWLTQREIAYCRKEMDERGKCPWCGECAGDTRHQRDCLWLAACSVHTMVDTA